MYNGAGYMQKSSGDGRSHWRQKQRAHRVNWGCAWGGKAEITLGVKTNTNVCLFCLSKCGIEKKGSLKENQGASGNTLRSDC